MKLFLLGVLLILAIHNVSASHKLTPCACKPEQRQTLINAVKYAMQEKLNSTRGTIRSTVKGDVRTIIMNELRKITDAMKTKVEDKVNAAVATFNQTCSKAHTSCEDISDSLPSPTAGKYLIFPYGQSQAPHYAYCNFTDGIWTVFQRRVNESVHFNVTWNEYKNGFGNIEDSFWWGNDLIHLTTSTGNWKLRVDLWDWELEHRFAEYSNFSILDEANKYKLEVSGYSEDSNAGDSLTSSHNNMKFSTWDQDNDIHATQNCALIHSGGWFFSDCDISNLNGLYINRTGDHKGIEWDTWHNGDYSMFRTTMSMQKTSA